MQQIGLLQIQTASSKNKLNAKAMEKPIQVSYPMKKKMLPNSNHLRSYYYILFTLADADNTTLEFTWICMDALAINVCQRYDYWNNIQFYSEIFGKGHRHLDRD